MPIVPPSLPRWGTVRRLAVTVLLVAGIAPPRAAGAQVVRGVVVDAAGGQPARGALVTLVDTAGARLGPTLVGEQGSYALVAPMPGAFRVRVDLIGYETWLSPPQAIGARDTLTLDVRLPLRRVELEAITVKDASRCEAQPQQVPRMLALWEEIRRALTISDLSTRRGLVPLDLDVVELRRGVRGVAAVRQHRVRATGSSPWAVRPARVLAEQGFVLPAGGAFDYVGPDAPILLSSEFVATHCFRSVRKRGLFGGTNGIGLSFEPAPGRTVPDVKGTIWLDARTSELRTVDFTFVNLAPAMRRAGTARGALEFARQPAGTWYVRRWEMTLQYGNSARGVATPVGVQREQRAAAILRGTVLDSTTGEPLVGAVVHVPGIDSVLTDAAGHFVATIVDMSEDSLDFVVSVDHPRLAALGLASAEQTVRLRAGQPVTLAAAIPSVATLMRVLCPDAAAGARPNAPPPGLLLGRVADASTLPERARIVAEWPSDERLGEGMAARAEERSIRVGSDGRFRACPLPVGRTIRVAVEVDGVRGPTTEVTLPATAIAEIELAVRP